MDYAALWVEAKYLQGPPLAKSFTIVLGTDIPTYIDGKQVTI